MKERDFQRNLIREIKDRFPGCIVLKNDPNYIQGIPDLLVLYEDRWAALEVKIDPKATQQRNQPYYIRRMNDMSYASFINPKNKEEVIYGMAQTFGVDRPALINVSKSKRLA